MNDENQTQNDSNAIAINETVSVSNVCRNSNIKRKLRVINTNAQSLQYKIDDLKDKIRDKEAKIIAVTETWGQEWKDVTLEIEKFTPYRKNRDDGRKGGGCIIYVSEDLKSFNCNELKHMPGDDSAWCWVRLTNRKKILVGCIYRSTSSSTVNNELLINKINRASEIAGPNNLLLLGDFNFGEINWLENDPGGDVDTPEGKFFECIKDCFLHQHVTVPTRFRGEQKSTLDLIFTKEEEDVKNIEVLQPLGKSDHGILVFDLIGEWRASTKFRPRRLYHKGNYEEMNKLINEVNWEAEFEGKTTNQKWIIFKTKLEEFANKCIPMSKPKKYLASWMNGKVVRAYKKKYFAWKRYMEHSSSIRWREYVRERNDACKIERDEQRAYEKKLAKDIEENRRGFFKYVNSKLTIRPEISALLDENGELKHDEKEMSNICNKYFHLVFNRPTENEVMPEMDTVCDEDISNIEITAEMVKTKLVGLNRFKGSGPDNIHPHVLKETASSVCFPLSTIFKDSLQSGETPDDWRKANITPIFKKGDRNDPANYRPVSLTSQVCKVMESIIRGQLFEHLKSKNLLSEEQHGFREGRSCLTNLLTTLEDWTSMLEDGDCVDVAYLDFRKAFDLVSHKHLLLKLEKHGVNGQILNWIKAFLENRKQKVVIRGCESDELDVLSGVPQGSVLGPILFLIFINDLPNCTTCPVCLFADDSKIYCRVPKVNNVKPELEGAHEALQKDLDELQKWAEKWKMSFNVNKCKIMHLGFGNVNHEYNLNGTVLTETVEEKDLGVLIDNKLNFARHFRGIVARANRMIGLMKISFESIDKKMFEPLYNTMIRPLLEYCVHAWSPHLKKDIELLENCQRRATKMVREVRFMEYEDRLKELKLPKLEDRRVRGDMILTYRLLNGEEGISHEKFFKLAQSHYHFRGDHSKKLYKPHQRLELSRNFFSWRVINKWNSLTEYEVSAPSTGTFKKRYDEQEAIRKQIIATQVV